MIADAGQSTASLSPNDAPPTPSAAEEIESLEAEIDSLPDAPMPGERPVSLDGQTGAVMGLSATAATTLQAEVTRNLDLTQLSINNPLLPAPETDGESALDPANETAGARPPQFRLRPTSEQDRAVYAVQKALGVDVETALALVKERDPGSAPADPLTLQRELSQAIDAGKRLEAKIGAIERELGQNGDSLQPEEEAELVRELRELQQLAQQSRERVQHLGQAREAVEAAGAPSQTRFEAEFDQNLELTARVYPEMADASSPLRQAMAEVQRRWELFGHHEKLNSPRRPQLVVEEARLELALAPERYRQKTSEAGEPAGYYATVRPAPGRVGAHPATPTRLGEAIANASSTYDLEELLGALT